MTTNKEHAEFLKSLLYGGLQGMRDCNTIHHGDALRAAIHLFDPEPVVGETRDPHPMGGGAAVPKLLDPPESEEDRRKAAMQLGIKLGRPAPEPTTDAAEREHCRDVAESTRLGTATLNVQAVRDFADMLIRERAAVRDEGSKEHELILRNLDKAMTENERLRVEYDKARDELHGWCQNAAMWRNKHTALVVENERLRSSGALLQESAARSQRECERLTVDNLNATRALQAENERLRGESGKRDHEWYKGEIQANYGALQTKHAVLVVENERLRGYLPIPDSVYGELWVRHTALVMAARAAERFLRTAAARFAADSLLRQADVLREALKGEP